MVTIIDVKFFLGADTVCCLELQNYVIRELPRSIECGFSRCLEVGTAKIAVMRGAVLVPLTRIRVCEPKPSADSVYFLLAGNFCHFFSVTSSLILSLFPFSIYYYYY